jgi:hypothetical protein
MARNAELKKRLERALQDNERTVVFDDCRIAELESNLEYWEKSAEDWRGKVYVLEKQLHEALGADEASGPDGGLAQVPPLVVTDVDKEAKTITYDVGLADTIRIDGPPFKGKNAKLTKYENEKPWSDEATTGDGKAPRSTLDDYEYKRGPVIYCQGEEDGDWIG